MLLLLGFPAQAATYDFSDTATRNLPVGCSGSAGIYSCGALSLAAGESITIGATQTTITLSGAFDTGGSVMINDSGSTSNLTMVVNGAATLGTGSTLIGNLSTLGAGAVNIAVGSWISGDVSTELGFVAMGAATTPTGVGGSIRTITGYVGLGAGAYVGGPVNTDTGYVSLGAGATINGAVTTTTAGYVGLGAGAKLNGDVLTKGAGSVLLGASSWVKGSITVKGTTGADYITTADSSKVDCNISAAGSYVTLGASTRVGGSVIAKDYVTVGAGVYLVGNVTSTENYVVVGDGSTVQGKVAFKTYATIDAGAHVYNNVVDTSACGSPPSPPTSAARFECLESASALPARLFTKLVEAAFAFDVMALKADGTQEANYVVGSSTKNVTLELVEGAGTTACASRAAIAPAVSQTLSFSATDAGRKAAAAMTVSHAHTDLRCRVKDANQTPSVVACSSDNFAVRPSSATLWTTATAAAPSSSATPAIKAGATFALRASTSPSVGYSGTLTLDASKLSAQTPAQDSSMQSGGRVGSLTLPANALMANAATATDAAYSEVGYLYLAPGALRDDSFTAVDSAAGDCITAAVDSANYLSDTLVGSTGKYGCSIGNKASGSLGRFYPDHFALTSPVFTPGCGTSGDSKSFTYMGQPLTVSATVEAQSAGSVKTQNFSGVFAKAEVVLELENANNGVALAKTRLTGQGAPVWDLGGYRFVATGFSRGTSPEVAYDSLDMGLQINSTDAALGAATPPYLTNRDMAEANTLCTPDTSGQSDGNCTAASIVKSAKVRYGRVKLKNAYGSERLALQLPMAFEYWTSNGWQKNSLDTCSRASLLSSNFGFVFSGVTAKSNLVACQTALSITGSALNFVLTLSAPGAGKTGWADVTLNLGATAFGEQCAASGPAGAQAAPLSMTWLQNSGTGAGVNPRARATFGVFKSPLIYRRENF